MSRSSMATAAGTFLTKIFSSSSLDFSKADCASKVRLSSTSASSARLRSVMSRLTPTTRKGSPPASMKTCHRPAIQ
jgi:hypothetical protein